MKDSCTNCKHSAEVSGRVECHKHPPSVFAIPVSATHPPDSSLVDYHTITVFPVISSPGTTWCGDHAR